MPYLASSAAGTQLSVSTTSSPLSYSAIPGVEGISGSGQTKNEIDVTAISDTAMKFVADLPNFGEFSFPLFWDPSETTHQALKTNYDATDGSLLDFKVTMDDAGAAEYTFSGFVKQWQVSHAKGAANKCDIVIKVTGAITVTP
jgi:hypothetical protein